MVTAADGAMLVDIVRLDLGRDAVPPGGPVFASDGALVGMIAATAPEAPAAVVPIDTVREVAEEIIAHGRASHPWIGITVRDLDADERDAGRVGARVTEVSDGGPAHAGGVAVGDVIVRIGLADGSEHSTILRPASPGYLVPERATRGRVAVSYWKIGTIHILEGFDHLLFVLALMLIVPNLWMLFKTITAFTLAHSASLALATLGVVNMPGAPTEAVIALSILFLAVEIVHHRQGRRTLTAQYPWLAALAFGLVHGLGFAGALAEVGLPREEIPLALLMFNIGVETGQILFVTAVLLVLTAAKRLPLDWPHGSWRLAPYTIGSIAAFWTMQRVDSFL